MPILLRPLFYRRQPSRAEGLPTDLAKTLQIQDCNLEKFMNRRPILGLTLTFLVAATLVTPTTAVTPQVGTEAANSQLKPNDAFVDVPDFVFGDGESLASLKLHYLTLGKAILYLTGPCPRF